MSAPEIYAAVLARAQALTEANPAGPAEIVLRVVEQHAPEVLSNAPGFYYYECKGCDNGAYAESDAPWPCRTFDLIRGML